jgi:hypothetical protein
MKVGILYICVARYSVFWKDFYRSAEKYFLPGIEKKYFVLTDEEIEKKDNVTVYHQESFGSWVKNVRYRYRMILKHQEDYSDCDYLYFFNANTLFRKKITPEEFVPGEKDNYLLALSFDYNRSKHQDLFPYERRPESCAYIPYGEGHYYYQSGVFGGRRPEYLKLITTCNEWVQEDEANNLTDLQDEVYMNKYLLDKKIKMVGSKYGKGETLDFYWYYKIIFRDKYKVLGQYYMDIKEWYVPQKFSFKQYSLKRFLRKTINRIIFKYRDARS